MALVDVDHDRKDLRIKHGPDNGIAERVGKTIDETLNNYADGIADEIRRPGLRDRIIIAELGPAVTGIVVKNPKLRDKEDVKTLVKLGNLHFNTYAYLAGSEQMADRVGLSYWSGLRQIPVQDRIRHMFLAGEAPSRQDMLELMIAWALEGLAYYDPRLEYDSKPSMPNEFAKRAIQLMLNDEENGAHEMAHKAVGRNYEGNIKKGIKAYVVKAGNIIVQELEAASVSNAST